MRRVRRRHPRDGITRQQAETRKRHQHQARTRRPGFKSRRQQSTADRAQDDGQEAAQFEHAIAPRQFLFRQQFRQRTILRRSEDGAVGAHKEHAQQHEAEMMAGQPEGGQGHDQNLQELDRHDHAAFAEPRGECTAQHGEKQKRQHQQRHGQRRQPVLFRFTHSQADPDEQGQLLERVVAEGALELRDDKRPETAQTAAIRGFRTLNFSS